MKQDFSEITLNINKLFGRLLDIYKTEFMADINTIATTNKTLSAFWQMLPDLNILLQTLEKSTRTPNKNPNKIFNRIIKIQEDFLKEHSKIYFATVKPLLNNNLFNDCYFNYLKKTHALLKKYLLKLLNIIQVDKTYKSRLIFYFNNLLDAYAPQNFLNINPELFYTTIENIGKNLLKSLEHYLSDLVFNGGYFNIRTTDFSAFTVGKNLATTKGKIVFQNDLMELIRYSPTTNAVYKAPILLIPPCINKYYILDLSEKNSLVKWLVNQGFIVYMISWVNPESHLAHKEFSDYVLDGPLKAIDLITNFDRCSAVHLAGYCIGGTLLSCTLSYMQKTNDNRALSATHFMSLVDFSNLGNIGALINETTLDLLENLMNKRGYLDGRLLSMAFNALRPGDLIWPYIIDNYFLNKPLKAFDILYWNSDITHLPYKMYNFYLREICFKNKLSNPNAIRINGVPINLKKITVPMFSVAGDTDHIAVWQSVYKGARMHAGSVEFVLANSGHIKGLINPPEDNKYSFKINSHMRANSSKWLKTATEHSGSWWPYWLNWLNKINAEKINLSNYDTQISINNFGDAPGSYVLKKINF